MHVVVLFLNIGGYHAARLRAAHRACRELGWTLTAVQVVGSTEEHPWGEVWADADFPVVTLLPPSAGKSAYGVTAAIGASGKVLWSSLSRLKPDVVFVPGWSPGLSWVTLMWCLRWRIPAVVMSESKNDDSQRTCWKERAKSVFLIHRFDAALVGGSAHRDYVVKLGMRPDRVFYGYDVVDNDHFAQGAKAARRDPKAARRRQPLIPRRPYFLSLNRFIPRKNILRLVEAYAIHRRDVPADAAWDLVLLGSGPEEPSIRSAISVYGVEECVHLPGYVPYQSLCDWYGLASAFVHPALSEQWGLVLNEACSSSLPILSSRVVGGARHLVREGINGWLFDATDAGDIAGCMTDMLLAGEERRKSMGHESLVLAGAYTPEHFASGLLAAVEAVSSERTR